MGALGPYEVDLPSTTAADYKAIRAFFTPLVNSTEIKSREAIAQAFDFAIQQCPGENPSDLWHHVLYRVYREVKQGTNPEQSWVRTSGEGYELWLVTRYNAILVPHGMRLVPLIGRADKSVFLTRMGLADRISVSKIDVGIEAEGAGRSPSRDGYGIVGGVHAKVSLAERVSDDIPASRILMAEGLLSILSTLDVKSFPPPHGDLVNRGELATPKRPSDKRLYVEDHGDFSACFSYNSRTVPSSPNTNSGRRVYVVDLSVDPDEFVQFLLDEAR